MTYIYADSTAILGALAPFAEPHAYDLCTEHSEKLTLPNGWTVIKSETGSSESGPNSDDIMAIADAVREVALQHHATLAQALTQAAPQGQEIGRRGHLRAIPSQ